MLFIFSTGVCKVIHLVLLQSALIWILFFGKLFSASGIGLSFKAPIKGTLPNHHTHLFSVRLTPKILLLHFMVMFAMVLVLFLDIRRKYYFSEVIPYILEIKLKKKKAGGRCAG